VSGATPAGANAIETLVEQRIAEQAGVPLSQMTGEQAVAAMLAAAVAPTQAMPAAASVKTPAELLTEYLAPFMEGRGPEAARAFVLGKASALMRLLYPARVIGVQDVVAALLNGWVWGSAQCSVLSQNTLRIVT
jgi:hypothetical protein